MRVRCATQRDHVFHPEMNYSQTQLASLIGSPSGGWPTISRRARTSKKDKELVTLENRELSPEELREELRRRGLPEHIFGVDRPQLEHPEATQG